MNRNLKIAGIAFAVLLLIAIVLPFLVDANTFRPTLESRLSLALGRAVKVGNLKLSVWSGGVTADDLSIADDPAFSRAPFVQAKSCQVRVDLLAFIFSHKLNVRGLTIDQPQIALLQAPSGDWNFSPMGTKSAQAQAPVQSPDNSRLDLSVKHLKISDGRITVGSTSGRLKPVVFESVNVELKDFSPASTFPFSASMKVAGGGSINLDGKAGPLGDSDLIDTPATMTLHVDKLDLAGSGLNQVAPQMAGLVAFEGSGNSGPSGVELNGKLKLDKLKIAARGTPATRVLELDFHIAHDLKKRTGRVHQGDIHIGTAITKLTGTYVPQGDSIVVDMVLDGSQMSVPELVGMLPALGIALPRGSSLKGGTAAVKATIKGPAEVAVIAGSFTINNTKLVGFNLSSKLSGVERLAGIKTGPDTDIQELSGDVRMTPDGTDLDHLKLVVPSVGEVVGSGRVNPDQTLKFQMQATVRTGGIAVALRNEPVPFSVDGTCSDPQFHAELGTMVKDQVRSVGKAAGGLMKDILRGGKK